MTAHHSFEIKGNDGYVKIILDKVYGFPEQTSHLGGYDVNGSIHIKCQSYSVIGALWTSTGEIYHFYKQLLECNTVVSGVSTYENFERNLELQVSYDTLGHATISGNYIAAHHLSSNLIFDIDTDQSFIGSTLRELQTIVDKYGDNTGVK